MAYQLALSLSDFELGLLAGMVGMGLIVMSMLFLGVGWFGKKRNPNLVPVASFEGQKLVYDADENAVALSRKNTRRQLTYPPGFPDGWYPVCYSAELKAGEVKYLEYLGLELAVYRGEDGTARILDAHCIHLGANMAIGGKVVGNRLECHFHRWQFNGSDGNCEHIPYCKAIPASAKTRYWIVEEYYGLVCFFFSNDEEKRLNPPYKLDPVPEIDCGDHVYRGQRTEYVHMHIQEFAENSVDFQHFEPLHSQMTLPFTSIVIPFLKIQHNASWEDDPEHSHIAYFKNHACLLFRDKPIPSTDAKAVIKFMGPGSVVLFKFITELGVIELLETHTPIEKMLMRVNFIWYADKKVPRVLVSYVVGNWISQWRNDIIVWENKVYKRKPCLVKDDGPVMKMRRWYSQFYSQTPMSANDW